MLAFVQPGSFERDAAAAPDAMSAIRAQLRGFARTFGLPPGNVRVIDRYVGGGFGVGAAIANAVHHANGRRIRDLPITLDKLL